MFGSEIMLGVLTGGSITAIKQAGLTAKVADKVGRTVGRATAQLSSKARKLGLDADGLKKVFEFGSDLTPCMNKLACAGDSVANSQYLLDYASGVGLRGADAVDGMRGVAGAAGKIGATTADIMQDFTRWLKKPFAGTHPERGAIGNSVDKTLEVIKGLRPEKAVTDGAVFFKDLPRALRSNTWDIMENLPQAVKGNQVAKDFIAKLRPHELTTNFKGWTSLDLVPNNPSASPLRFLYKKEADGSIKWMIRDTH